MRAALALCCCLCTIALAACGGGRVGGDPNAPGPDPSSTGAKQTVALAENSDGTLNYCDPSGACAKLPNPGQCTTLTITIDTTTGAACQVCTAADGSAGPENCKDPAVACDIVTIPDPNCVVCAYVNGTVIFSTCEPQQPTCYTVNADGTTSTTGGAGSNASAVLVNSDPIPTNSGDPVAIGSDPIPTGGIPPGCTVCVDAQGNVVSKDCPPVCNVACAPVTCADGYQYITKPGECCGTCEPIDNCTLAACLTLPPDCPDGQVAKRDPTSCCAYYCEPTTCDNSQLMCP
jgi:hypothetical protein